MEQETLENILCVSLLLRATELENEAIKKGTHKTINYLEVAVQELYRQKPVILKLLQINGSR